MYATISKKQESRKKQTFLFGMLLVLGMECKAFACEATTLPFSYGPTFACGLNGDLKIINTEAVLSSFIKFICP